MLQPLHSMIRQLPAMLAAAAIALFVPTAVAGAQPAPGSPARPRQTEADAYTRYELLAPGSAKFRIVYEVTATAPGATLYFNPIRKGSTASDETVTDRMTGAPLTFEVVPGAEARAGGLASADTATDYIRVHLARPVPAEGGARVLIIKTYQDTASYFEERGLLVFSRSLSIKRNAVVLPPGYELVACNYPSQVRSESDGRISVSFINTSPAAAPLVVRARRLP
ncbi:MAG: hypothetical protein WKG32_05435 [Gemmatimonadaceae bacterium]